MRSLRSARLLALSSALSITAACGGPLIDESELDDAVFSDVTERLTALATPCAFDTGTGVATVALADDEVGLVARRATDSAILVNGEQCGTATATTLKRIDVTGSTGDNTFILDFINGTFAAGTASAVGVDVDLGGGTGDSLRIRGSKNADTVRFGDAGLSVGADNNRDMDHAGVEEFIVSLGDGNDNFSAQGGNGSGTSAFASAVTVYGGAGNDTLVGGGAADVIDGGDGNDTITGAAGDDTLAGGAGNDTFNEEAAANGADTFAGDDGTDTVSYALRTGIVTADPDGTADDGEASEGDDIATDVEVVTGGSAADVLACGTAGCTLNGGAGDDALTGGAGDDTLNGGDGADTLVGGDGADVYNGGNGDDTFDEGSASNGGDVFNGGAGADVVDYSARTNDLTVTMDGSSANDGESGEGDDVNGDVENILGGAGDDAITGNSGNNHITGGAGADTLSGGAGNDTFDEGAAASGDDVINGGTGTDTVDYSARTNAMVITMDGVSGSGEGAESDTIGTDVENLWSGSGADVITGNALENHITGGAGADVIDGGAGNDQLEGGDDADVLNGGAGDDVLDGEGGADVEDGGAGDGDICFDPAAVNCEL